MSANPIDEAVREQAAAWFAEYDKHKHFHGMLALDAYAAGHTAAQQQAQGGGQVLGYVRRAAIQTLRADDEVTGVMVHIDPPTDSVPVYLAPPSTPVGVAEAWQEGYRQGVLDERTSEANIGIAGFGAKVEPARNNPYALKEAHNVR